MRAHYLQHVPFEGLGSIEPWLLQHGYTITCTRLFDSEPLPDIDDVDFLIVMGGPMSVNDEDDYPWLATEKTFISRFIKSEKPVLGICLGAQLIAVAMGAEVFANSEKEIGWFPIEAIRPAGHEVFQFPTTNQVFHWHGETFHLPDGAVRLAKSDACDNQAFQLGDHVIGLQFHLETTEDSAKTLIVNCRHELVQATHVQSEAELLSAPQQHYACINRLMDEVLEYLHKRVR